MKTVFKEKTEVRTTTLRRYKCQWCGLECVNKSFALKHEVNCEKSPISTTPLTELKIGDSVTLIKQGKTRNVTVGKNYIVVDFWGKLKFRIRNDAGKLVKYHKKIDCFKIMK